MSYPTKNTDYMKKRHIAMILSAAAAAGLILYLVKRNKTHITRLSRVANEGYETAEDILYPLKHNRKKR
ncbi:MAG: hypothetical protein NVS1B13_14150 [Flavisolibacter sp.]